MRIFVSTDHRSPSLCCLTTPPLHKTMVLMPARSALYCMLSRSYPACSTPDSSPLSVPLTLGTLQHLPSYIQPHFPTCYEPSQRYALEPLRVVSPPLLPCPRTSCFHIAPPYLITPVHPRPCAMARGGAASGPLLPRPSVLAPHNPSAWRLTT